jgi:hypothetical protein
MQRKIITILHQKILIYQSTPNAKNAPHTITISDSF